MLMTRQPSSSLFPGSRTLKEEQLEIIWLHNIKWHLGKLTSGTEFLFKNF